jgi:hypothetical protein
MGLAESEPARKGTGADGRYHAGRLTLRVVGLFKRSTQATAKSVASPAAQLEAAWLLTSSWVESCTDADQRFLVPAMTMVHDYLRDNSDLTPIARKGVPRGSTRLRRGMTTDEANRINAMRGVLIGLIVPRLEADGIAVPAMAVQEKSMEYMSMLIGARFGWMPPDFMKLALRLVLGR